MKIKKVIEKNIEISFNTSNRGLPDRIDEFLNDSPDMDDELWQDNHSVLRDYEGDFDGILIFNNSDTKELIMFICEKIGESYQDVESFNFKLIC